MGPDREDAPPRPFWAQLTCICFSLYRTVEWIPSPNTMYPASSTRRGGEEFAGSFVPAGKEEMERN